MFIIKQLYHKLVIANVLGDFNNNIDVDTNTYLHIIIYVNIECYIDCVFPVDYSLLAVPSWLFPIGYPPCGTSRI